MNIEKFKMTDVEFKNDEWEFIFSLVFIRYGNKINILEIGEGNYPLLYAICNEHSENIKNILSIDVKNTFKNGDKIFYEKKRIFSALANRGYNYVEHFQGNCLSADIEKTAELIFSESKVNVFVIEYIKDDSFMDSIFNNYSKFFDEKTDIYYHNVHKSLQSLKYFEKMSDKKRNVILRSEKGTGIGIIKNCRD